MRYTTLALVVLSLSGCATQSTRPGEAPLKSLPQAVVRDSSVDIAYVLGHSHRRLLAWSKQDTYGGQTQLDHQILKESTIDSRRYAEFLAKVEQFVASRAPAPALAPPTAASDPQCRTPFTVTLKLQTDTRTLQGCRGADDGALSRLVRDGEFLLYSKQ